LTGNRSGAWRSISRRCAQSGGIKRWSQRINGNVDERCRHQTERS
jgi:hypothetical protein